MGKYIIETGDDDKIVLLTEKGVVSVGSVVSPELAQFGIISAKEYEGPEEGECDNCSALRNEYHRGYVEAQGATKQTVDKVWKAAMRIACIEECGGLTNDENTELFGTFLVDEIFKNTDPYDAVRILAEYDKKATFELGDEVEILPAHEKAVFVCGRPNGLKQLLRLKGDQLVVDTISEDIVRTGSNFTGLKHVLEALRKQNDDKGEEDKPV